MHKAERVDLFQTSLACHIETSLDKTRLNWVSTPFKYDVRYLTENIFSIFAWKKEPESESWALFLDLFWFNNEHIQSWQIKMSIQFQWRHLAVYSQPSTDKADQCSFLSPPLKMCLSSGKKLEKKNIVNHRICWIKVEYAELYICKISISICLIPVLKQSCLFLYLYPSTVHIKASILTYTAL